MYNPRRSVITGGNQPILGNNIGISNYSLGKFKGSGGPGIGVGMWKDFVANSGYRNMNTKQRKKARERYLTQTGSKYRLNLRGACPRRVYERSERQKEIPEIYKFNLIPGGHRVPGGPPAGTKERRKYLADVRKLKKKEGLSTIAAVLKLGENDEYFMGIKRPKRDPELQQVIEAFRNLPPLSRF